MKAYQVLKYGKKEKLDLTEVAEPTVKDNDVLVQIHVAGVILLDSMIKQGEFKLFLPYKPPFVNGHDVAGVVTKVGSKVRKFKVGDELYARSSDYGVGTFSEYISIDENDLAFRVSHLSMTTYI